MAETVKSFVLQTLSSPHVDWLNFRFDNTLVYPSGYRNDVARAFESERIRITINYADVSHDPPAGAPGAAYAMDTARGQTHYLFFPPALAHRCGRDLCINVLTSFEEANLRRTIIHECTHALQDYQRVRLTPQTAEASAYLAGAITGRRWGDHHVVANERAGAHAYAFSLADRLLQQGLPHRPWVIPAEDIAWLKAHVLVGRLERYVFNGI